jgi:hypothetical protein
MLRPLAWLTAFVALAASQPAEARPPGLKASAAPRSLTIDGEPKEWDTDWRDLDQPLRGNPDADDLSGKATIAYDDEAIYLAADIRDDKLVGGADHVELLLGIPGGMLHSFTLYPGVPGKSRATVKGAGRPVRGAEIVEAPTKTGYSLEARIPWDAVPRSRTVRIGYRGAIFVHDADGSRVESVLGTAGTRAYRELPPISMEPELALGSGLLRQRNLTGTPRYNLMANVVGDALEERVLLYDRFLIVLGPSYRNGEQYYFRDLGADGVPELDLGDLTGDGRADIKLTKRVRDGDGSVDVLEILSYHSGGETPDAIFSQELRLAVEGGRIDNQLSLNGSGSRTRIVLEPGKADGIDPSSFRRESNSGATPVLVPWGRIAQQTFAMQGGSFVMVDERKQESSGPPPPAPPPLEASSAPRARAAPRPAPRRAAANRGADVDRVYALYKEQRSVRGAPRFDRRADLAEDGRQERLVVHGRDLVVFGPGYRGGRGFAAVTMAQFEQGDDIRSVTTRDVSGDGKDEIVVKGVIRSPLPSDIGHGEMERTVLMIYKLDGGNFDRVFAAEIARRIGNRSVTAKMRFVRDGAHRIELRPGSAKGYDERSYPWAQKQSPDDGFEPLLLPWGGIDRVRLRWTGSAFER